LLFLQPGVLDCPIGVAQTGADNAKVWIGRERFRQGPQPRLIKADVVVAQQDEPAARVPHAEVDRGAKAQVLPIEQQLKIKLLGRLLQLLHHGSVGGAVVHDEELQARRRRREATAALNALGHLLDVVDGGDDDRAAYRWLAR